MKENEKTNTQNNNINSGDKLGYLQLIQEPICRMFNNFCNIQRLRSCYCWWDSYDIF